MPFGEWVKANNSWIGLAGLITGTVIGVVAIAYAVLTTPHAAIPYEAKAISLVDATRVGGALKVIDQNGNKINSNVSAIEIAVWNSGGVSLGNLSDRVREPLSISLSPNSVSIVEAVIQRTILEKNLIQAVQTAGATGLVGDGDTNNNTTLQNAFTAAAAGGTIIVPCGVYKITATTTVTVASGKSFLLGGGGQNCTKIAVSGPVGGIMITQADETAGVSLRDFTVTTDQAGTQSAITLVKTTANVLNAYAAPISIQNVSVYGTDYPNASNPTKYWAQGITLNNVNNVTLTNVFGIGGGCVSNLCNGNGINVVGKGSGSYGVVFNVARSNFGLCGIGIAYGDWIQGVAVDKTNVTGCQSGITVAQSPSGVLDQLIVSNSQFNNFVTNIYADTGASGAISNVQISNSLFLAQPNTDGIRLRNVVDYVLTGNSFNPLGAPSGATAIHLLNNSIDGTITGNTANGYAAALKVDAAANVAWTTVSNNDFNANTTDYSIGAAVAGLVINDPIPRNISKLFSCQAGTNGSKVFVNDGTGNAVPTYHGVVAGGGAVAVNSPSYCDGSGTWKYD